MFDDGGHEKSTVLNEHRSSKKRSFLLLEIYQKTDSYSISEGQPVFCEDLAIETYVS